MPESGVVFADATAMVEYLTGANIPLLDMALRAMALRVPALVAVEVSAHQDLAPKRKAVSALLARLPKIQNDQSRLDRVSTLKAHLEQRGRKVSTVDAELIQLAIDHGAPLVTRNPAHRDLHKVCGVKLEM